MKRSAYMVVFILAVALMVPSVAMAKKSGSKSSSSLMSDNFQAGVDVGAYVYGAMPFGSVTWKGKYDADLSGSGGFGPILGAHFNMFAAKKWIIHFDFAYGYQSGTYKLTFDEEDEDYVDAGMADKVKDNEITDDYGLELFRGSVGIGNSIAATSIINPYWMLGLAAHHMAWQEADANEALTGTGLGPFGALGVDAKIVKTKGMTIFGGGQFRLDIMYSVTPLTRRNDEITMAYVPVSLMLTGGVQF